MTRREAIALIAANVRDLDHALDKCRSQFAIRLCYVTAHSDMVDLARKIVKELEA